MSVATTQRGSNNAASGNPSWSGSVATTTNDKVVVTCHWFATGGVGTPLAGSLTSTPSKTWVLDKFTTHGNGIGVAVYSWDSDGATLTALTFANPGTSTKSGALSWSTTHSANGALTFTSATAAVANDTTSPFSTTAAAAISGTSQSVAFRADFIDTGSNTTWTAPAGYSTGSNNGDGSTNNVYATWFKDNETGTPTITDSGTWSVTDAVQVFVTYQEPVGASTKALPFPPNRIRPNMMRR